MKEIYNPRSLPSVAVGKEVAPFPQNILLLHASLVWSRVCPAAFPVASCPTRQLRLSNKQVLPSTSPCLHQVSEVSTDHPVLYIKHLDLWVMSWTKGI